MAETPRLDPALAEELTRVFKGEAVERVAALRKLFGELQAKQGEPDAVLKSARREAHNLKGSAATVDFTEVQGLALRLEKQIDAVSGGGVFPSVIALTAMKHIVEQIAKLVEA